ncbi:MAG: DNA repair protein RadC [Anaerolineales bacterium]
MPSHKPSGIAQWPPDERPRERLLSRGAHALTDAELLAIILRVGVQGKNAVALAHELLKKFGSLQGMMTAPLIAWEDIKGVKSAKLAQLQATLEIGRRVALPTERQKTFIKSTTQAASYFSSRLLGLPHEHFRVAYLNRLGRVLDDALIAEGTVDSVRPYVRVIVARALQTNASTLILAHNHPSGSAQPSESDQTLTREILAACNPLGLRVLEHVIVSENEEYSFADSGLLDQISLEI